MFNFGEIHVITTAIPDDIENKSNIYQITYKEILFNHDKNEKLQLIANNGNQQEVEFENWTKNSDGFYYYTTPIQTGETSPLIVKCESVGESPDTQYFLSVNIISQTIQAVGSTDLGDIPAHKDGWKIKLQ